MSASDTAAFIRARLPLQPVAGLPGIILHRAAPDSGVGRLAAERDGGAPYWAYPWAGGLALARHVLERPATVRGRRVMDLGTGSGLVAIAAAKAGAAEVVAIDRDPLAVEATCLNARANGVAVTAVRADPIDGPPPDVDLVLAGDVFYDASLAAPFTAFLLRCVEAGREVLVGDPWRAPLPTAHLTELARYTVAELNGAMRASGVFAFSPPIR